MKIGRAVAGLIGVLILAGCSNGGLARQMVTAPNRRMSDGPPATRPAADLAAKGRFYVGVGPPEALIAGWVIEPKREVRGTIVLIHGFLANHVFIRGAAQQMADAGYRAVMVDLRGHGQSTGRQITYGAVESHDMVQVLDYLQKHGLAGETVGVYGTSLGAAVALQWAAIDPRVNVVVAVASYSTLRDEAPHFAKVILPLPGLFLSPKDIDEILTRGGEIAHFDPDAVSPIDAIKRIHAPILLVHGDDDSIIPVEHSKRLHAAAPESELVILPGHGHLAASYDWGRDVSKLAREFFDKQQPGAGR